MSCLKKALEDLLCRYLLQAWEYDTSKYPGPPHRSVGVRGVLGFRRFIFILKNSTKLRNLSTLC